MSNLNIVNVDTDFEKEYCTIRKTMKMESTNLEELSYKATLLYVNAPDNLLNQYSDLVREIELRKIMLSSKTASYKLVRC